VTNNAGLSVELERTPGLASRAVDAVRGLILEGAFPAGSRLNEVELAGVLGISRAPVREALHRLAAEGIVTLVPRRGAYVRRFNGDELKELYEVREALETMAARLAATRATTEHTDALFAVLRSTGLAISAGSDQSYPLDLDFHSAVLDASGNGHLRKSGREVQLALHLARARSGNDPRRAREALGEHRTVAEAIRDNDPSGAAAAMSLHLQHSFERARSCCE
jgi:DNA-binding GntR family transcriptional regulator